MHLYHSIDHSQWSLLSEAEQRQAKTELSELVQEIRSHQGHSTPRLRRSHSKGRSRLHAPHPRLA